MSLREYQSRAIADLRASFATGERAVCLVLPTGGGKTRIAAEVIRSAVARGRRVVFCAHRQELIQQSANHLASEGLQDLRVIQAGSAMGRSDAPVTVASIQTLATKRWMAKLPHADLLVLDECFPAGTRVGDVPIEDLRVGDMVPAFDGHGLVSERVARLFKSIPRQLVTVHTTAGAIACTAGHPFYTRRGWRAAALLTTDDEVLHEDVRSLRPGSGEGPQQVLSETGAAVRPVHRGAAAGASEEVDRPVSHVRRRVQPLGQARDGGAPGGPRALLARVLGHVQEHPVVSGDGGHKPPIRLGQDEGAQPDALPGLPGAGEQDAPHDGAPPAVDRWTWEGHDDSAGQAAGGAGTGVGSGIPGHDGTPAWTAGLHLPGPGARGVAHGDRGRRPEPQRAGGKGSGPTQGAVLAWRRVDRVEVHEPGSDGRFGGLCPDGFVYNIEVERLHTYVAGGFVVHNCHHVKAASWQRIAEYYARARIIGLTATPERSDGAPLGDIFGALVVASTVAELTSLGFLVPCEVYGPAEKADALAADPVEVYLSHGDGAQAVVFCTNIVHATDIADRLVSAGVAAACVDGQMDKRERRARLARFKAGELRVVTNCMCLCLDDRTEILTSSGWTGIDEMTPDHLVANWDAGTVTFEKPLDVVRRQRGDDELMVALESSRMSIRVTGTHRMLYRTLATGAFLKRPARDLVGRAIELPVSGRAAPMPVSPTQEIVHARGRASALRSTKYNLVHREGMTPDAAAIEAVKRVDRRASVTVRQPSDLTADECRLIGFWLGDGSANRPSRGGVEYTLSQSKVYPKIIAWVDALLDRCGVHRVRRERETSVPHVRWSLPRGTGGGSQQRAGVRHLEPYLDKDGSPLLWGLDEQQFDALIEGFWYADGDHKDGTPKPRQRSRVLHNANQGLLSLLQAIGAVRGYKTHLYQTGTPRKPHHAQMWCLVLRQGESFHAGTSRLTEEATWLPERVWCVKTRTKNIITRRNGSVVVMGNTEGWDAPATEVCILARGAEHAGLYQQMVGRVLRTAPGKTRARVYDLRGVSHVHGLPDQDRVYSLTGKAISTVEKLPPLMQCRGCGAVYRPAPKCPQCGRERPVPESPEVRRQRLERIFASHGPDKRAEYLERLRATASERGYHPNWISHRMRARYGRAS